VAKAVTVPIPQAIQISQGMSLAVSMSWQMQSQFAEVSKKWEKDPRLCCEMWVWPTSCSYQKCKCHLLGIPCVLIT